MIEIESAPFEYEAGSLKYSGVFLAQARAEPSAAFVLLPDWRGRCPSWSESSPTNAYCRTHGLLHSARSGRCGREHGIWGRQEARSPKGEHCTVGAIAHSPGW